MADGDALRKLERSIRRRLDAKMAARRAWESLPAIVQIVAASRPRTRSRTGGSGTRSRSSR